MHIMNVQAYFIGQIYVMEVCNILHILHKAEVYFDFHVFCHPVNIKKLNLLKL